MGKRGAFKGARLEFLLAQKPAFQKAINENNRTEVLADIQRRFFKRFPLDKPENWEPTMEELEAVDDDAPDDEPQEPNQDLLTPEEFEKAKEERKQRLEVLASRRNKIRRWFRYQFDKDHSVSLSLADDPYFNLIQQLFVKDSKKPRLKTAVNLWRKIPANRDLIEAEVLAIVPAVDVKELAKTRDAIARRMFSELDEGVQHQWKDIAAQEHAKALKDYEANLAGVGSISPEDRQRAIECLTRVMQPIMEAVCKMTGWVTTFMAGGPEPARNGSLSILSVHAGVTAGPIKMNFGAAESVQIKEHTVPIFTTFVRKCFTAEMRRAVALSEDKGFLALNELPSMDQDALHIIPDGRLGDSQPLDAASGQTHTAIQEHVQTAAAQEHVQTSAAQKRTRKNRKRSGKGAKSDMWDGLYSFSEDDASSSDGMSSRALSPALIPSAPPSPARSENLEHNEIRPATILPNTASTPNGEPEVPNATIPAPPPRSNGGPLHEDLPSPAVEETAQSGDARQLPANTSTAALIARVLNETADAFALSAPSISSSRAKVPATAHAADINTLSNTKENVDTIPLAPRSTHPSVSASSFYGIEATAAGQEKGGKKGGTKRKTAPKEKVNTSKRRKENIEKASNAGAAKQSETNSNAGETTVRKKQDSTTVESRPGLRRSTRGSSAVNPQPSSAPVAIAPEGTVVLRTGKVAKKSKFWTYEEVDVGPNDNGHK